MFDCAVILPVWNRRAMVLRAIRSVLNQSEPPTELIVVDDASTDDLKSVKALVESEGGVWISLSKNSGPAAARNAGVAASTASWLAFLDSDDEWLPEKVSRQMTWHQSNPEIGISQVKEGWYRNGSQVSKPGHWVQREGDLFEESVERCSIGPSCVAIRRDIWDESGGFDERYRVCEDYELWLRITARHPIGLVPGDDLVRKNAGHTDQLSTLVPAMDRYRAIALLACLQRGGLSESQVEIVVAGLKRKSRILAEGARKRNNDGRSELYRRVEGVIEEGIASEIEEVLAECWEELES